MAKFNLREKFAIWWFKQNRFSKTIFQVSVMAFFLLLPFLNNPIIDTAGSSFQQVLFYPISIFVLLSIGLNIVVGKSGLLDLGYVAFFAIGAYTMAILGTKTTWNFYLILLMGMGFAMLSGVILGAPTLRLRGDYLAIVTLGFGEIVRIVAVNIDAIGGPRGISGIPTPPPLFGYEFTIVDPKSYYWILCGLIFLTILAVRRWAVRRPGRAWDAIRQDDDVAQLMGINTFKYKIWAFVLGAAVAGAGGVIYASQVLSIAPEQFSVNISILVLACVVFGGIGNLWGVIVGGFLLAYIPERIRFLSDYRVLVFGLVLVIMMNLRPDGIIPRKKWEKLEEKKSPKEKV
jgi:branched-chain amino acid transport system permease protein